MLRFFVLLTLLPYAFADSFIWTRRDATPISRSNNTGHSCCNILASFFDSGVIFPDSEEYQSQQSGVESGYFSLEEQSLSPACRVSPRTPADVSTIVQSLVKHSCKFAVRGGGHMIWPGSANIQGGVTVDLSLMKGISVSPDRRVVSAGPGCRWGDLFRTLDPQGLAVVGGRVSTVGIAGLTIGGGNSWYASRYGFVCDNVVNLEVVLSSGRLVNANATENADLYKALKGGGNNFGIVTRFDYRAIKQQGVWGGFVFFSPNTSTTQLQALESFNKAQGNGEDAYAAVESIHAYNSSGPTNLGLIIAHTKPEPNASIFDGLLQGRPQLVNDLRVTNLSNLTVETAAPPGHWIWAHTSLPNNATTVAACNQIMQETLSNIPVRHQNYTFTNAIQPISRAITSRAKASGGNVLGLSKNQDVIWSQLGLQFFDPAEGDEEKLNSAVEDYLRRVEEYTKAQGQQQRFVYLNYAFQTQKVIQSYGQKNVKFLEKVSRDYDEPRAFQDLVPGGFKLGL